MHSDSDGQFPKVLHVLTLSHLETPSLLPLSVWVLSRLILLFKHVHPHLPRLLAHFLQLGVSSNRIQSREMETKGEQCGDVTAET